MQQLKIGLPKGSLQEATLELLEHAGWEFSVSSRSYYPRCNDPELWSMLARPQEMSRYVERGVMDMAITGLDWTRENGSDVEILERLTYAKASRQAVRWVLAVPEDSPVQSVQDLAGKVISTEVVNLAREYFTAHGVEATIEFSHGATEVKVPHLADAIIEITETGSSLVANNLRIVDTICESLTVIIANKDACKDDWKRSKMDALCLMLKGALTAKEKVLLKLNVAETNLEAVTKKLPGLHAPTVNHLSEEGWVAVEAVLDEHRVRSVIPDLKAAGAEGIIELPLNKVIP